MDERAYWLWLQHGLGAGSSKPARVLAGGGDVRGFFEGGPRAWRLEGIFTEGELQRLLTYSPAEAEGLLEYCDKLGQTVISLGDSAYPDMLREIHNPPCVLFVKGELPTVEAGPFLAIIGTRKATNSGVSAAQSFACAFARAGAVVVSGGALGIDTAAHKGALLGGGKTICVLGCGIDYNYLMSNASMREAIVCQGALVSEYPPGTPSAASNFPIRNRIISGLCHGALVVEAAAKSGSLITADLALDQGRDVFAVPGGIYSPVSQGANRLIKDGAKPVTRPEEVLEEYEWAYPLAIKKSKNEVPSVVFNKSPLAKSVPAPPVPAGLSANAAALFAALSYEPTHIAGLLAAAKLPPAAALPAVTELELLGLLKTYSGQRYALA